MDIRKHLMGDDIFVGDLEKEISKLDGVINLVKMRIFNKVGEGYSTDRSTQQLVNVSDCDFEELDAYDRQIQNQNEINLEKSDYMLFSEADSMFEIKYKNRDIEVIVKTRN